MDATGVNTPRYTTDPELLAMSDDEYIAAIAALSGSAPDEDIRASIDAMNTTWWGKLDEINDAINGTDPHS